MSELATQIAEARAAALDQRFPEAATAARRVVDTNPTCLPALRALAWAQVETGDRAASESFQTCATLDPEDAYAEVGLAMCLERQGERPRALERLIRAWELEPDDQKIRKEVVRLGGEFPDSPLADGIALLRAGRDDPAITPLRQAAAATPPDVAASLALATALWRVGGRQQAYNLASIVLGTHPHAVKAILFVVAVEASSGRLLRTRELLARAEQVDPGFTLYGDLVQETGLEPVLERHTPGRKAALSR